MAFAYVLYDLKDVILQSLSCKLSIIFFALIWSIPGSKPISFKKIKSYVNLKPLNLYVFNKRLNMFGFLLFKDLKLFNN